MNVALTPRRRTTRRVLMVRPTHFSLNGRAHDNVYMGKNAVNPQRALRQFNDVVRALKEHGIHALVFDGRAGEPDAIFPNNSFATTWHGKALLGAMHIPNRKNEKNHPEINAWLTIQGYEVVDLALMPGFRTTDCAELTGSLIIDHRRNHGFIGLSKRCTENGARIMAEEFGLDSSDIFRLTQKEYHTNVVLSVIGGDILVIVPSGFQNQADVIHIQSQYEHVIVLTEGQKNCFAGNVLALGDKKVLLSRSAHNSLNLEQEETFRKMGYELVAVDISELEKGGGSMRCLLCEIW